MTVRHAPRCPLCGYRLHVDGVQFLKGLAFCPQHADAMNSESQAIVGILPLLTTLRLIIEANGLRFFADRGIGHECWSVGHALDRRAIAMHELFAEQLQFVV